MADPNASQTPRLTLPLPVASHTLRADVERLRDALMEIDTDLSDVLEKLKTVWQDAGELNGTDLNALTADTQGSMYQANDAARPPGPELPRAATGHPASA